MREVWCCNLKFSFSSRAFDMASAEKFCRLLHRCAELTLPVICFISSGGMQTKEGAGALFSMAAINDRITHFVRDYDLPVLCSAMVTVPVVRKQVS